jgi:hypothetical protein
MVITAMLIAIVLPTFLLNLVEYWLAHCLESAGRS